MNTILVNLTLILGLIAPVIELPGTDAWFSQFVAIFIMANMFIANNLLKIDKHLTWLFVYCVLSTIFVARIDQMSFLIMLMTGLGATVFIQVSQLNSAQRTKVLVVLFWLLMFQIAWGWLQFFNLDPIFRLMLDPRKCDTVGFSGSHNQYSLFLSALSPLCFSNIFLLAFVTSGLVLSKSISGLFGMICALGFFYRKSKMILVSLVIALPLLYFGFCTLANKSYGGELDERTKLWQLSISQVWNGKAVQTLSDNVTRIITCSKWTGFGFGTFFKISPYTQTGVVTHRLNDGSTIVNSHRFEHAHNDYVEIFFELGIVGFAIFLICIFNLVGKLNAVTWNHETNLLVSMIIAVAISALSIYAIFTAYNAILIVTILGMIYSIIKKR